MKMPQEFPCWIYQVGKAFVVQDQEALDLVDGEWFETPWDAAASVDSAPDRAALVEQATALGVKADGRWSVAKLQAAIDAATPVNPPVSPEQSQ